MANWKARTSSDAAGAEYQVFLNFRGYDTRHNFTDFLYDRLVDAGVRVFRDEEELPPGDFISDRLERAINYSTLYIPIFSPNYASSKWCLRELKLIVDNVSNSGDQKSILPIFFLVKPDDVKLKPQSNRVPLYKAAFDQHEKDFPEDAEAWKMALSKVDERKGWVVKKKTSQASIVNYVVQRVMEMLKIKQKLVTEHLVGLDERVQELIELLDVNHPDMRLIAIYGMGGIGKTTIAKEVFNQLFSRFGKRCSFLEDVRKRSSTKEGIVQLQKQLLTDIVCSKFAENVKDSEQGMQMIGETLPIEKVLVVLDDVHNKEHIKILIGNSPLHPGSRIIVTTRDRTVLQVTRFAGKIQEFDMLKMDDGHALQLFCQHAFGTDFPSDNFNGLSSEIVPRMGGLPLALKVIGSLLKGQEEEFWTETLVRLGKVLEDEILEVLKISYNDLKDDEKQNFLDIACFLVNKEKTKAIYMWASCRLYPIRAIKVLTDRCLIKILDNDKFWMHDTLIDLGRHIVCQESPGDLGKQSRLWIEEDALQIIRTQERKDKVQALDISRDGPIIEIRNEDIERLPNLRFLHLTKGTYAGDFAGCLSNLRWLSWSYNFFGKNFMRDNLEMDFRVDNLYLDRLVVCELDHIDFKDDSKAWDLIKGARDLKVLSINWCSGITTIPDISICSTLERLTLHECSSLKRIESFIGDLQLLIELKIEGCREFTDLPEEVGALAKLKHFSLSGCRSLRELPCSLGNLASLTELDLTDMPIRGLPNSIGKLKSLRILRFPAWFLKRYDWQLPDINTLVNLEELNLSGHHGMKGEIPVGIGEWSSLRILNLESTGICEIPRTINMLHHLQRLNLRGCQIQELPEVPTSLTNLLVHSKSLLSVPNLSKLTNLVELVLNDGSDYIGTSNLIPGCDLRWIRNLSKLKRLELNLLNVPAPLELASLSHLKGLVLGRLDLKPLEQLSFYDWNCRNLSTLEISCCEEHIPLEGLPRPEKITVTCCTRLQRLSFPLELRKLKKVRVSSCRELVEIQVVGLSKSLKILRVSGCESLTRISGLPYLKNLETLRIADCHVLANVEGLNELDSLKSLVVYRCRSLRSLIDASCTKIPDDCRVTMFWCGYPFKDCMGMRMKRYREEVLSKEISFTIRFHLGVKKYRFPFGSVGGIERVKEGVNPDSVTYEGLIADVKNFGFRLKRMWRGIPHYLGREIKSDEDVNEMVQRAARGKLLIHLFVKGGVDSEWEGEYDDEMMEMLIEERRMKIDVDSGEDGAKGDVSCPNEDSNSASVDESKTHGTSVVDDFELERAEKDLGRKRFRRC